MKYKKGYTQGVFDMFHIGHLNLINHAKDLCDYLIVGVNSDCLVEQYKKKVPVVGEQDRREIVSNIKAVDECLIVNTLDKENIYHLLGFDAIFIGDDWKNSPRWIDTEKQLAKYGVDVIYLSHTPGISSTGLRSEKDKNVDEG